MRGATSHLVRLPHSPSSIQDFLASGHLMRASPSEEPAPHASTALPWELSPDPENVLILQPRHRVTRALGSSRGPESTSLANRGLWAP